LDKKKQNKEKLLYYSTDRTKAYDIFPYKGNNLHILQDVTDQQPEESEGLDILSLCMKLVKHLNISAVLLHTRSN